MKRYLPIILLLVVSLMLPSCAGIGDGALIGRFDSVGNGGTLASDVPLTREFDSCVINVLNSDGHSSNIARPNAEASAQLLKLFTDGSYVEGDDTSDTGGTYIRVLYESETYNWAYLVYSNDVVRYSSALTSSFLSCGTQEGIYQKVRSVMDEANKAKNEASSRAGYSVSNLIVTVKSGYAPKPIDYTRLDCIGIFHLMDLNTGETMYTFHFDSDTKERIDEIAAALKTYEPISGVSYNYIMTLD